MPRNALPAPVAVRIQIGEPHSERNLALRIDGRRESSNVTEVAVHVRMQLRKLMMHRRMLRSLGESRGAIRELAVRICIFEFLCENAVERLHIALLERSRPSLFDLHQGTLILRLSCWTSRRIPRTTKHEHAHRRFHTQPRS